MIEYPANFQAAEVSAERQPGFCAKTVLSALASKIGNIVGSARVLPNDCISERLTSFAVPHDGSFALVGNPDGCEVGSRQTAGSHGLSHHGLCCAPNFLRIVLQPSRLRIDLLVLSLRAGDNPAAGIEHNEPSAGRALVEGAYIVRHRGLW